jgi:hypothetical protein
MAILPIQQSSSPPGDLDFVAASAGGDEFGNSGGAGMSFWIENTSGADRTVTFTATRPCENGVLHDHVVTVATGTTPGVGWTVNRGVFSKDVGRDRFNNVKGRVAVSYSSESGVQVAAAKVTA